MVESLYEALNGYKPVAAIFLDLQKAFDNVEHKLLLEELKNIGLRGSIDNILKTLLRNIKQKMINIALSPI